LFIASEGDISLIRCVINGTNRYSTAVFSWIGEELFCIESEIRKNHDPQIY